MSGFFMSFPINRNARCIEHRAESSVRSLPGNTSLTAIERSDFGEESFEVVLSLLFPSDFSTLVKEEGENLCQATG